MPNHILHYQGSYNLYSKVSDAAVFDKAVTLEQLENYTKEQFGIEGLNCLPDRLKRAHETGTSEYDNDLNSSLICNRAGENGEFLPVDEFIKRFLTQTTKSRVSNGKLQRM